MAKFTTMRVYEKDKKALMERFGGSAHEAFHKAIDECEHPEGRREYLTADLPIKGSDQAGIAVFGGFYCHICNRYIFKAGGMKQSITPSTMPARAAVAV